MPATFEYEKTIAAILTAAAIPGLRVDVSADMTAARYNVLSKPTAIVCLGEEAATGGNARAVAAELTLIVTLVLRGAASARTAEDVFFREEIFQALHGVAVPGLTSELAWVSTASEYEDNARMYQLAFLAKMTKHKRAP